MEIKHFNNKKNVKQSGFTLLEYAAGAAVLMGILYVGVRTMGFGIQDLMGSVGKWANDRSQEIDTPAGR
jgi:hypothetical protein